MAQKTILEQAEHLNQRQQHEEQFVVFQLGSEEYGVEIHEVREIIKIPDITHVPNAPVFVGYCLFNVTFI